MAEMRNNLSVLPLYDSLEEQLHRRPYTHGYVYPLVMSDKLVDFCVSWAGQSDSEEIRNVEIFRVCNCRDDNVEGDFNRDFSSADFDVLNSFDPETIKNYLEFAYGSNGSIPLIGLKYTSVRPGGAPPGQYYLKIDVLSSGEDKTFYSEVFTVVPEKELNNCIKLEWFNTSVDIVAGDQFIPYSSDSGYKNTLYLNTFLGRPSYEYEEEGTNRDGYFFPEKQISKKLYRFNALVPEYLADAMRTIALSDIITITDQFGQTYKAISFNSEVEWLEEGYLANIQCEFSVDDVIKVTGKPINI